MTTLGVVGACIAAAITIRGLIAYADRRRCHFANLTHTQED